MFSQVCVCPRSERYVTSYASWDRSHGRTCDIPSGHTLPPPPRHTLPPGHTIPPLDILYHLLVTSSGHHWRPVQSCSLEAPHHYWHLVVATKTHTFGKREVCILLELFNMYTHFACIKIAYI